MRSSFWRFASFVPARVGSAFLFRLTAELALLSPALCRGLRPCSRPLIPDSALALRLPFISPGAPSVPAALRPLSERTLVSYSSLRLLRFQLPPLSVPQAHVLWPRSSALSRASYFLAMSVFSLWLGAGHSTCGVLSFIHVLLLCSPYWRHLLRAAVACCCRATARSRCDIWPVVISTHALPCARLFHAAPCLSASRLPPFSTPSVWRPCTGPPMSCRQPCPHVFPRSRSRS